MIDAIRQAAREDANTRMPHPVPGVVDSASNGDSYDVGSNRTGTLAVARNVCSSDMYTGSVSAAICAGEHGQDVFALPFFAFRTAI